MSTDQFLLLVLSCLCHFHIAEGFDEESPDSLFENGVDAFVDSRWDMCISHFESALSGLKKAKESAASCQRQCNEDVASMKPIMLKNVENLQATEKIMKKSLCFLGCSGEPTSYSFDKWKTYEYLQHCYFQKKLLQKAASAAYTVVAEDPTNKAMISMLEFYATMPGIDMKRVTNLEAHPFLTHYRRGLAAYETKDFKQVIKSMEQSLQEYLAVEELCRAECASEEPPLVEWLPEYSSPVVSHIVNDLKCKRRCPIILTSKSGERQEDLPADHFKYLHFAYFKVGEVEKACKAISSALLFRPNDANYRTIMTHYKENLPNAHKEFCLPRSDTVKYVTRQNYEHQLLHKIEKSKAMQEGGDINLDLNSVEVNELTPNGNMKAITNDHSIQRRSIQVGGTLKALDETAEINEIRESFLKNIRLVKADVDLKGPNRFLAEGIATEEECKTLVEMAQTVSNIGNGYLRNNNPTPFSKREELQSVKLKRAALMGHFGIVEQSSVDKLFEIGDRMKAFVEHHFNLQGKLYHEHFILVCRDPFPVKDDEPLPNSHPLHADNCRVFSNGSCIKEALYSWRDYSSVTYLNGEYEGGEFYFAKNLSESGVQSVIKPKCGSFVGFSSGVENIHAVRGLRSGLRCTIVQMYTLTPTEDDKSRISAQTFRDRSRLKGTISDTFVERMDQYHEFS